MRDADEPTVGAWFKYPNPAKPHVSSLYSFAAERAAIVLAQRLGLPVPDVYLEEVDGELGLVSMMVPGYTWKSISDESLRKVKFVDRDRWTLYLAFDVLVANHDRHDNNIHVEWQAPLQRRPDADEDARLWLIDYGWSGLWPPAKYGFSPATLEEIPPTEDLLRQASEAMRNNLPPLLRMRCAPTGSDEREETLAKVQEITDDHIREAVAEIPDTYLTAAAADLTVASLCGRLARIDRLMNTVFPL